MLADEILERIAEYRRAARIAVTAEVDDPHRRFIALLELADAARAEEDPVIRTWSERAIWEEAKTLLGMDDATAIPESYERAQRRLRSQGLVQCPVCRSELASDRDLERWSAIRTAEAERRQARERAVRG